MSPPERASRELVALALATRPDWDHDAVLSAIARAQYAHMPWPHVLLSLTRLMCDADSTPAELAHDAPRPWEMRRPPQSAEIAHRGAALARAACITRTDTTDTNPEGGQPQ